MSTEKDIERANVLRAAIARNGLHLKKARKNHDAALGAVERTRVDIDVLEKEGARLREESEQVRLRIPVEHRPGFKAGHDPNRNTNPNANARKADDELGGW